MKYRNELRLVLMITLIGIPLMSLGVWWGVFLAAMISSLLVRIGNWSRVLFIGSITGFLIWLIWSAVLYFDGGLIISQRIGELFHLHPMLLLLFSGILGGILSGLGAVSGDILLKTKESDQGSEEH
ncbi:MAG: hypothetical protein R3275_02960 [Saprospiraceae bacterium]|nr:hypothetical protein [Saprospiraceae bacterium]